MRSSLGIAMIMVNEQRHVPAVVTQFFPIADDIVIIDGGSTDRSVSLAAQLGVRVVSRNFKFDFADQRNFSLSQLSTDWVYVHDCDERLDPYTLDTLKLLVDKLGQEELMVQGILRHSSEPYDCFGFARKNFIDGLLVQPYPDYQYRLFRSYCRYEGKAREQLVGFKNATVVDFNRNALENPARFNILHYKSAKTQVIQEEIYDRILA